MVFPSEGGHSELSCFDRLSDSFYAWLRKKYDYVPGAELAISGQGIANIFEFICTEDLAMSIVEGDYEISQKRWKRASPILLEISLIYHDLSGRLLFHKMPGLMHFAA